MKRKTILCIIILFTLLSCNTGRKAGIGTGFSQVDFVAEIDSLTYYWHRFAKDSTLVTVKSNETILSECTLVVDYVDASCDDNGVIDIDCKDSIFVIHLTDIDISKKNSVWNLNNTENANYSPEIIIQAAEEYHKAISSDELPTTLHKE